MRLKNGWRQVGLTLIAVSMCSVAPARSKSDFGKVLNQKGFNLVDPAESWIYPGGLVVANKKNATFVALPAGLTPPTPTAGTADFAQQTANSSFNLSAILSGFTAILGGNPGVKFAHDSKSTLKEIKATSALITDDDARAIIQNSTVMNRIKEWLAVKGTTVYVVHSTLLTKDFSLTKSSTWGGDLTFNGSTPPDCSANGSSSASSTAAGTTTGGNTPSNSTSGGTSANGSTSSGGSSGGKSSGGSSSANSSGATSNSGSSSPGGTLHLCKSSDNTISMSTDIPLVFAASANSIGKNSDGTLNVYPVVVTLPVGSLSEMEAQGNGSGGGQQKPNPQIPLGSTIPSHWSHTAWPGPTQ